MIVSWVALLIGSTDYSTASVFALWDAEQIDTNTLHDTSTNNQRITIPSALNGKYGVFQTFIHLTNVAANSFYIMYIRKNSTTFVWTAYDNDTLTDAYMCSSTPPMLLTTGDIYDIVPQVSDTATVMVAARSSFSLHVVA